MSDVGWGSDHLAPQKKRKIPLWIWGCGGGCMFLIGATIVAAVVAKPSVERWIGTLHEPDVQWPILAEVLPFDEPPEGVTIVRFPLPLVKMWKLAAPADDLFAFVFAPPKESPDGPWAAWLTDPKRAPMFEGQDGTFECVEGTLTVQGRELRSVRFTRTNLPAAEDPPEPSTPPVPPVPPESIDADAGDADPYDALEAAAEPDIQGNGLDLVITSEASPHVVLMWLVRGKRGETVSDEQAAAFLAPFKIGSSR
ncbi:MAG TPA: hypothetical protein VM509_15305 [Planctomycetota bacterium]|nr:hypothetical protein [Planctomycetota bacterium]